MSDNPTVGLPLSGSAALIIGGGSGIGLAAAAALVQEAATGTAAHGSYQALNFSRVLVGKFSVFNFHALRRQHD